MRIKESENTSTARVKPNQQTNVLSNFRFEDLESIREIELQKRRERVENFHTFGW